MMGSAPVEPSADKRQVAHELREMYLALRQEGFTKTEALTVIGQILAAASGASND